MKTGTKILYPFMVIFLTLSLAFTYNIHSQSWNSIGSGTNGVVHASVVFNGDLIVAGKFTSPGSNIARWNGTNWNTLGTGTNDTVFSLAIYNGQLVAAGAFTTAGGVVCNRIARWNGSAWTTFGIGLNNTCYTTAHIGSYLRAGGRFTTAGGVICNRVARFDGTNWSAMGSGVNGNVYAMTQFGNDLILGGEFTIAGGNAANRIVRFNLTSGAYTALGTGIDNNAVFALSAYNNNLYVGGNFTLIGGITINNLARWSGTNWNTVSSGTNGPVRSMLTNGNTAILIGGEFTLAGGATANRITSYNGSTFFAFGAGITGGGTPSVKAITIWSNVLTAGGLFTTAGTSPVPANNIAGWGSLPAAPVLVSPADGATGISLTPLLTWQTVQSATTYWVQVSTNPNFTVTVLNVAGITVPQYNVPSGLLSNNVTYFWRVSAANGIGTGPWSLVRFFTTSLTGIINTQEIPLKFNLYQNYPNPFNPKTKIRFDLPLNGGNSVVKLIIYNISGGKISELLNTEYQAGKWEIDFDAGNFASGVYFYKIEAGEFVQTNKMILIK